MTKLHWWARDVSPMLHLKRGSNKGMELDKLMYIYLHDYRKKIVVIQCFSIIK